MSYGDVFFGLQTWTDYISTKEEVRGFESAIQEQTKDVGKFLKVGIANQQAYQTAVESGFGAISGDLVSGLNVVREDLSRGITALTDSVDLGFDRLAGGIDQLNADFNLLMGDVVWKLEVQGEMLASILYTLQAPLDTQAKELRFRAEDAYKNGWYEEALGDFLESERKNYQDFAVHRSLGNIYLYHLTDLPKALDYFRKASKYARPRDARQAAEAEYFSGIVCGIERKLLDAAKHMTNAIELNPKLYDAWYMHAGFVAMLGDANHATKSLGLAIKGDARYHERAKKDRIFENLRSQIESLLDRLMEQIRSQAGKSKRTIHDLAPRISNLLPEGRARISRLISEAELHFINARTYNDYYQFTKRPNQVESELRTAEQQRLVKDRANQERATRERAEQESRAQLRAEQEEMRRQRNARAKEDATKAAMSNIGWSIFGAVILYPVVGVGGCIVRIAASGPPPDPMRQTAAHDAWLSSPLSSFTLEAILIPVLVVAITIVSSIVKITGAGNE